MDRKLQGNTASCWVSLVEEALLRLVTNGNGASRGGQRGTKTGRARESKKLSGSAGLGVRRGSGELGQNSSGIGCANKLGTSFGICWSAFPPFYAQN